MDDIAKERPAGYRYSRQGTLPLIRQLSVIDNRRNALLLTFQWAIIVASDKSRSRCGQRPAVGPG